MLSRRQIKEHILSVICITLKYLTKAVKTEALKSNNEKPNKKLKEVAEAVLLLGF